MLIDVKMQTIIGVSTFITEYEYCIFKALKARNVYKFQYFRLYER